MHRLLVFLTLLIPLFASAQSVYMHEAQDDAAANSEPISVLGIITLLIIVGIVYVVCKLISGAHEKTRQKKYEAYNAEYNRQKETKEKGGFICPICGKQVLDNNYSIRIWSKEQIAYSVKICSSCNDRYYPSKFGKNMKRKQTPTWVYALPFIFLIGLGLYVLIRNIIIGQVFMGIIGMIIVPTVTGGILGWVFLIVQKLTSVSEPKSPLNKISIEHIRDCNAIKD